MIEEDKNIDKLVEQISSKGGKTEAVTLWGIFDLLEICYFIPKSVVICRKPKRISEALRDQILEWMKVLN